MTILYEVHNGLYVNLTNQCPCACTFCIRQNMEEVNASGSLWLEREPTVEEVKAEFSKFPMEKYSEVVFCGFGEPTERIYDLLEIASFVKEAYGKKIRVNTNGLGNLIHGTDITPLLEGKIDCVSISLNTPNAQEYDALTQSRFGARAFDGLLEFAGKARQYVPEVVMTTVATTITQEEEQQCKAICDKLGVKYRIRPYEG
ncbi:MAG: Radical superfamily [Oscillospiraceae bacterium]|nr:Radical superfamily [Oscillospiraceae bacterium]